ncbi:MAG TPA: phage tail protein [Bacteroidales bacterium]|nr:phage tail protein [Bacteroidales bacterium]
MKTWFECKARYDKEQENGNIKTVNELYMIDAVTFTDSEERINKELSEYISGEFSISKISRSRITEIIDDYNGEWWYKLKVGFKDIDQKSGKEKVSSEQVLISADNLKQAYEIMEERLKTVLIPWTIQSIAESPVMDVFYYTEAEFDTKQANKKKIESVEKEEVEEEEFED